MDNKNSKNSQRLEYAIPLSSLEPGRRGKIIAIDAGYDLKRRLLEMGITPGAIVEVLSSRWGPLLVRVRGSVIAIGRGVAAKILVVPLD